MHAANTPSRFPIRYSIRYLGYHRYYATTRSEILGLLLDLYPRTPVGVLLKEDWAVYDLTEERFLIDDDLYSGYDYEKKHP